MTEEETKGRAWQAVMAGLIVLGTGPVALALLVLMFTGLTGVGELIQEGGTFSYVVLFTGALASLIAAVLAGLSVRRPGLPAPLALMPFLLPLLAALAGVITGVRAVMSAISSAAPGDKGIILIAATSELSSLSIQALTFAAAGALVVTLAAVLTLGAPGRGGRVLTLLGGALLGFSLAAAAMQSFTLRNGFSAIAHASPVDRLTILAGTIGEWQQFAHLSSALFLACVVVAVAFAAVLTARGQKAMGLSAGAALLIAAVGVRGSNALTEQQLFAPGHELAAAPRAEWITFDGREPINSAFVALEEVDAKTDVAVARQCRSTEERRWVAVELRKGLRGGALLRALQTAHYLRTDVELIGGGPRHHLEAPAVFDAALASLSELPQAAPLRVLFNAEPCEGCDGVATASAAGLVVKTSAGEETTWKQDPLPFSGEVDAFPGVEFTWAQAEVEPLVRAALIALSHGHLLVVRVAPPESPPALPDY